MRRLRAIAVVTVAVAILVCASQAAAAAILQGVPRKSALVKLGFKNHDGYRIEVGAFGQTVALRVTRGRHPSSSTTYLAHGRVTPTSVRASFGDRGRIAVRFRPSGRYVRAGHSVCRAARDGVIGRHGVFVGELRFDGEAGYTSADVHRVSGESIDFHAFVSCLLAAALAERHTAQQPMGRLLAGLPAFGVTAPGVFGTTPRAPGVRTHPSTGVRSTTLFADGKLPLSRTVFAAQARGSGRVRVVALEERSEGSIAIVRYAHVRAPRSAFVSDSALSLASVTPPPPFSGTGTLQRGAGAESWTGSLAVSFLGAGHVPLTGSLFTTRLARSW